MGHILEDNESKFSDNRKKWKICRYGDYGRDPKTKQDKRIRVYDI